MLWFKKQPDSAVPAGEADAIVPAALPVALDPGQFQQHFAQLGRQAEEGVELEALLASLRMKSQLFSGLLNAQALPSLSMDGIEALLETVFSARRRVFPALQALGVEVTRGAIQELLYGNMALAERLQKFSGIVPLDETADKETRKQAAKNRRAAFDFGAEMLHFNNPVKYPLMTRWVWDQNTVSGALREFIRGNDSLPDVPLGNSPEMFEGARAWLAEQIAGQGLYKDVPFWIDLILAQAYSEYFRSMAEGMLSADFGRGITPQEQLKKFLGIDAERKAGQSRVKRDMAR
ncbi:hypothetical protein TPL01_03190 [Sulfuriferula plumbiphila]|uniref:Uncharacterized protein n=1 Tax=Sulfuriferula plumbiphila TaxID=171865 RepID=A0A512L4Q9_9PROT|nr:hypothetical protein [Sulfuriferula plumbiphila]BBP05522.1 hypothetical protein SFPGR_29440 [Sulfuriferula plumbiphila]GEP29181.1 hypothetical protein TPL01_03190 [Sulfuriferula plumbiphila]